MNSFREKNILFLGVFTLEKTITEDGNELQFQVTSRTILGSESNQFQVMSWTVLGSESDKFKVVSRTIVGVSLTSSR